MSVNRIFFTRALPERPLALLKADPHYDLQIWPKEAPPSKEVIRQRAGESDALVTLLSDQIDREVLSNLKGKIVAQYAVGVDNIDLDAAEELGITVTNTPGVLTQSTADLTWALLLAVARRISEADAYVRAGLWKVAWGPKMLLGIELAKKTLGIIGLGRIGQAVAMRARGFGMQILYTSRNPKPEFETEYDSDIQAVPLEILLRNSDIITIHAPLTNETRGLIGSQEFSMMKPSAILINTARGLIVDEKALCLALESNQIAGAGLDVFHEEPLDSQSPLLRLKNVVIAPHIGSATKETRERMAEIVVENIKAHFEGRKLPNPVIESLT
ncbi:MAG: 2-hydroxyacid dehydrogenase [Candidatus Thorarchaeota archaeon]